jgi:hypothetical protein
LGGGDQEGCTSRPAWRKSWQDLISISRLGIVVHVYKHRSLGGILLCPRLAQAKSESLSEKNS